MNKHIDSIAGSGMRTAEDYRDMAALNMQQAGPGVPDFSQENGEWRENEANANAVEAALAQPAANTDRGIFERSLAVRRAEKAKQQAITAASVAKTKQLTISIRAIEDALDGILVSEG